MRLLVCAASLSLFTGAANAQIGLVDFDGTELGLTGYTNGIVTYAGPGFGTSATNVSDFGTSTWGGGDAFWPMTRAAIGPNGLGMPFQMSDDSVSPAAGNNLFETDTLGFAGVARDDNGFFGVTDTQNGNNDGPVVAEFNFDVSGAGSLSVSIDFAAMGDFEAADLFNFEYSIDGGTFAPLFTSSVDEDGMATYTMDSGTLVDLNDPVFMNGTLIDDNWQTLSAAVAGTGSSMTIRLTAMADGGSEGFGFDNITVTPTPGAIALLGIAGLAARRRRRA